MYANGLGIGGILPIQVSKNMSEVKLELTGNQGDTMKESMRCARNIAFGLMSDYDSKFDPSEIKHGIHIHCPATSTPKDGPSAGGAITIAIYSFLTGKPILQNVAMTGEIDLIGNITNWWIKCKTQWCKTQVLKLLLFQKKIFLNLKE